MFEGLLSPVHLLVLAFVVFLVVGPRKVAARWSNLRNATRRLTDGPPHEAHGTKGVPESGTRETQARRSLAYRIGRRVRRR